jgi:hypothetical protein
MVPVRYIQRITVPVLNIPELLIIQTGGELDAGRGDLVRIAEPEQELGCLLSFYRKRNIE